MSRRNPVLFRVIDSFFRYRWLFIISVIVVSAATMWIVTSRNSSFSATALTQVSNQNYGEVIGETERMVWITPAQQNVNKFSDLINDDLQGGFLDTALRNANLSKPINLDPRAGDERYKMLRRRLSAATQGSTLFGISLAWPDKRECEQIVSALQRQYIEEVGLDRSAQSIAATKFLDSQLEVLKLQLQSADQAVTRYKLLHAGVAPENSSATITRLNDLLAQRDNLMVTSNDAALTIANLEADLSRVSKTSIKEKMTTESPLIAQLNNLKARQAVLESRYLPTHPEVIAGKNVIASMEKRLRQLQHSSAPEAQPAASTTFQDNPAWSTMQDRLSQAKIQQVTLNAQMANLNKQISTYQDSVRLMPEQERTLSDKMRSYKILQTEFDNLSTRRVRIEMKGRLDKVAASSTLTPIGRINAEAGLTPTKMTIMLIASILFGFLVGALMVVLSEWSDHSLRYDTDAERILGVAVLASIPETPGLRLLTGPGGRTGGGGSRKLLTKDKRTRGALPAPAAAASMQASAQDAPL